MHGGLSYNRNYKHKGWFFKNALGAPPSSWLGFKSLLGLCMHGGLSYKTNNIHKGRLQKTNSWASSLFSVGSRGSSSFSVWSRVFAGGRACMEAWVIK